MTGTSKAYRRRFVSLDRSVCIDGAFDAPDRYRDLFRAFDAGNAIAQGAGLSYVAASFDETATAVSLRRFNRILAFDPKSGRITAESGITLAKLFDFLLPHGFYVSVQPGHPQLSLGGLIAANIHGKNQYREGVFADIVEDIAIYHPDHGELALSRNERPELFELTCGGYGLTGAIIRATIRTTPIPGRSVRVLNVPVGSLTETCQYLTEAADRFDMLQSWNDLSRLGPKAGAGFVICGQYDANGAATAETTAFRNLDPHTPNRLRPKIFRRWSMPLINSVYHLDQTKRKNRRRIDLFSYLYPVARKAFYFDWYGRDGFFEHQVLIPPDRVDEYFEDLLRILRRNDHPVPRASIKLFKGAPRFLNYNGTGFSLSMDFFHTSGSKVVLAEIDALDRAAGARANIIKDSRLSAETVRAEYAEYGEFRDDLRRHDPKRRFVSALSRRLEL